MGPTQSGPSWVTSKHRGKASPQGAPERLAGPGKDTLVDRIVGQATPGRLAAPGYQAIDRCLRQTVGELAIIF